MPADIRTDASRQPRRHQAHSGNSIERWALYLIMALLPFYRWGEFSMGVASLGTVDLLIIAAGGLSLMHAGGWMREAFSIRLLRIGSGCLFLGVLLSFLNTDSLLISFVYLFSLVIKFLLLGLVCACCRTWQHLFTLLAWCVASNTVSAAIAIGQQLELISGFHDMASVTAAFDARNEMLYYLIPATVACLPLLMILRGTKRLAVAAAMALMFTATLLSRGRSGLFIEMACMLGLMLPTLGRRRQAWKWTIILAVTLVTATWMIRTSIPHFWEDLQYRYLHSIFEEWRDERGSMHARKELLMGTVDAWRSHPVLGIGAGTFQQRSAEFVFLNSSINYQAHNSYMAILAECGVIGAVGWLLICLSGLRGIWKSRANGTQRIVIHGVGFAYLSILLFLAGFDGLVRYNFWMFLGLVMAASRLGKIQHTAAPSPPPLKT